MLTFFKILFFGSWVTITQSPIDINSKPTQIILDKTISAITPGAHLRVDISSYVKASNVIDQLNEAQLFMGSRCLSARLNAKDGKFYILDDLYQSVVGNKTSLVLTNLDGVPTDIEFISIVIKSCKPINSTTLVWVNYRL